MDERRSGRGRRPRAAAEPMDEEALFAYAVGALARRMLTEQQLRQRLQGRAEPGEAGAGAIGCVLERLKELRYLSDERYAAVFARARRDDRSQGRRRVLQDLKGKGIPQALAEEAVAETHDPGDELALARAFVERKRLARPTEAKGTARLMGRLVRNGFRAATVFALLREWEIEVEETDDDEARGMGAGEQ